ncbi:unnamed protein product [Periconia digitata]|uniref:Transthyretin/hydroxyisourate hydrolase domain-containing protein n=1 Tax=Periconia digitata TaxID=1303443 RepID=A0A9W4UH27_9PLEO|nr:unnamed protein product [Periconia digitata]
MGPRLTCGGSTYRRLLHRYLFFSSLFFSLYPPCESRLRQKEHCRLLRVADAGLFVIDYSVVAILYRQRERATDQLARPATHLFFWSPPPPSTRAAESFNQPESIQPKDPSLLRKPTNEQTNKNNTNPLLNRQKGGNYPSPQNNPSQRQPETAQHTATTTTTTTYMRSPTTTTSSSPNLRISQLSNHLLSSSSSSITPAATATMTSNSNPPTSSSSSTPSTPTPAKPPITCHVLDTTIGRPARGIPVTLTLAASSNAVPELSWTGLTNSDGRVVSWDPSPSSSSSNKDLREVFSSFPPSSPSSSGGADGKQRYTLSFAVLPYLAAQKAARGGAAGNKEDDVPDPFFEDVVVKFVVGEGQRRNGEHFHVPLLLGGFGYSVYRGS